MHVNREQATQLKKNTPKQPRVALTAFCSNHERDKTHSTTTQSRTCFELDHAQLQLQLQSSPLNEKSALHIEWVEHP